MRHLNKFVLAFGLIISSNVVLASQQTTTQNLPTPSDQEEVPLDDIRRFTTVINQIKNNYVEPVEDEILFTNAIRGLLSNLDPHSRYLDTNELKNLNVEMDGELVGIGVELTSDDKGEIRVVAPLDGSPAEKAGVKPGDVFLKINNNIVNNMTLEEAGAEIRGKKGTKVHLELLRSGAKKVIKLNIPRDMVKLDYVKSYLLDKYYGYIRIPRFHKAVGSDLKKAVNKLNNESDGKLKGIILDLRNNTGGLLTSAVEVSELLLDVDQLKENKKIVYTKKKGDAFGFTASVTEKDILKGLSIVALINGGSASSAEIVAGALQDHNRAVIVGEKSFGKGSVQTVLPVDENSAISLTTELYYTPLGHSIQAKGITPDVIVKNVKIAKAEEDEGFTYREEDLARHFDKEDEETSLKDKSMSDDGSENGTNKQSKTDKNLARSDFQLYSALNLLKGLQAVQQ